MTTRLAICNGALLALGERQLASLSENRAPRRYLDVAWNDGAVDVLLSAGQWKFAQRSVEMTADANLATEFGYQYAFTRPSDFVRTTRAATDEFFNNPFENYEEEKNVFYAAMATWYLSYVSNDATLGNNLALWPSAFTEYAKLYLARRILVSLTGNKTDKASLDRDVMKALAHALSLDAMEAPTQYPPSGSWVNARTRGRTGGWDRGRRTSLIG